MPIPVWYGLDDEATPTTTGCSCPQADLPIDPVRPGSSGLFRGPAREAGRFRGGSRRHGHVGGKLADPHIAGGWEWDNDLWRIVPHGPDPTRSSDLAVLISRPHLGDDCLPGATQRCGWILDPDRKKMSSRRGNVVMGLLDQHGADAVGTGPRAAVPEQTPPHEGQMKILNAPVSSRCPSPGPGGTGDKPLDLAMLAGLRRVVRRATAAFEDYNYARALELTETFFWSFC